MNKSNTPKQINKTIDKNMHGYTKKLNKEHSVIIRALAGQSNY